MKSNKKPDWWRNHKIDVGDLVKFHARAVFEYRNEQYANPGIIIDSSKIYGEGSKKTSYCVLWSNGKITSEHGCYIIKYVNDESKDKGK